MSESALTLYNALRTIAERQPEKPALVWDEADGCTYAELLDRCGQMLGELREAGFTGRSRIAVVLPQGPEMALSCLTLMLGASCVPLNPDCTAADFTEFYRRIGVACLITRDGFAPAAVSAAAGLGIAVIGIDLVGPGLQLRCKDMIPSTTGLPVPPGGEAAALVLPTSGSTARPKLVPLTQGNLLTASRSLGASLQLQSSDRCLSMMPMFHVGALVDLLLAPLLAGGSVVLTRAISAGDFIAALNRHEPTWFQAVPTILSNLVDCRGDLASTGRLRLIRSVSSALSLQLRERLEQGFGLPVIEIYGMTETGGVITSNPLPPGVRKPGSVGLAQGCEVTIVDALGNRAAVGLEGEVIVRGAALMAGYVGADNSDTFLNGWLRTGDQGYLDAEGYLYLTGRIKDIINRGGEKIAPREIDEAMAAYPGVREAAAFAIEHDTLGEEVAAALVIEDQEDWQEADFLINLGRQLAHFKVPRRLVYMSELPRGPGGKLLRYELNAKTASPEQVPHVEPKTPLGRGLVDLWRESLGVARIGMNDNFFDLGGDSLSAAEFLQRLERQFGREVQPAALFDHPTVAAFETYLIAEGIDANAEAEFLPGGLPRSVYRELVRNTAGWRGQRQTSDSLVVGRNTLGSRPPLFLCWNGALNAAADYLGAEQPIYCMRDLWGLDALSAANNELLARHYAREILDLHSGGPLLLGGFCEGAKIAFAAAQWLREQGVEVALLVMIEQFVAAPYDGPVAFFFSDHGRMSAYHHYERPELGWHKYYRNGFVVDVDSWEHQQFVEGRRIEPLLAKIVPRLEQALTGSLPLLPAPQKLQRLDNADYNATLICRLPRYYHMGRCLEVPVTLTNASSVTWEGFEHSGVCVCGRWRRWGFKRVHPGRVAGTSALPGPLPGAGVVDLKLTLQPPHRPGIWVLEIDVVEQGVTWFDNKAPTAVCRVLFVNASLPRWWLAFKRFLKNRKGGS